MFKYTFEVGSTYKREDVSRLVGDGGDITGNWATGYPKKNGVTFIFANVGSPGQTGHDYENYFDGREFVWRGRTGSTRNHRSIKAMATSGTEVHIFWRSHGRDPFTYAGTGSALSISDDSPVQIRWKLAPETEATNGTHHKPSVETRLQPAGTSKQAESNNMLSSIGGQVGFDGEALSYVNGFYDPSNRFMSEWLPWYNQTTEKVASSLSNGKANDLYDLIWRTQENGIAHAGKGMPSFAQLDGLKEELVQLIFDIKSDGSPEQFDRIVAKFKHWRDQDRISIIPWLLIARAFAAIHPRRYHTTVNHDEQVTVSNWLKNHTDFSSPATKNWAELASAITTHLAISQHFKAELGAMSLFPWFVIEQVRNRGETEQKFEPGHKPRKGFASVQSTVAQRTADLRHNLIQTKLFSLLSNIYGKDNVKTEMATGTGGLADAVVRLPDGQFILYEIKIAETAALVVRQAVGQLMEYGFRTGGLEPVKLFAVGEPNLDEITQQFLVRLRVQFGLQVDYLQITLP